MSSSLPYVSTLTLLIAAVSSLAAQETQEPDVTPVESENASAATDESSAPNGSLPQGAPFWKEGTFTATLEEGDLILQPTVSGPEVPEPYDLSAPAPAPAMPEFQLTTFSRTSYRLNPEFLRGDYSVLVAGQNVKHSGRYMVSRFEQHSERVSLKDDLRNPVIFRTSGGPKLTAANGAFLAQSEKAVKAYFVNDTFDAQNLQRMKMAETSSSSGSDSSQYIVVLREVQGYQAVKPGVVTKVIDEKSEPTVLIQYNVTKCQSVQKTRTVMVPATDPIPASKQVDELPEAPKSIAEPKIATRMVPQTQTYTVTVPYLEAVDTTIDNPQLLLSVTPETPAAGPAFAPVELSATSLPVGTKVLMVNSPAEAARVYQQLRSVLASNAINDLPFSPVFLVDYAAAD